MFHIVSSEVGDEEMMMIGFVDLAFLAPLDGSNMVSIRSMLCIAC
jgi:hypothetical protein